MFLPLYILVAVVHIFAKNNNYYIKTPKNPDFDVRVRRDAPNSDRSIDFNGVTDLRNGENDKEAILLKELIKTDGDDDGNIINLRKNSERNSDKNGDIINRGGVTELCGNEKVLNDLASIMDGLKELLLEYNDNDEKNINANEKVRREVESTKNIEGDIRSDYAELQRNAKVWNEIASRNIENLWNNISSEFDRLGKLMSQDLEVNNSKNSDTKVKREAGSVKVVANDDKINDKIVDSKNNAKLWKEIASVVDEVKEQVMEHKDYIGKNRNVNNGVRREENQAKIVDGDIKTSADGTDSEKTAKWLKEIVPILHEIHELISGNKNSINDVKELKKPDSRVKRDAKLYKFKYAGTGFLDSIAASLMGYNEINIGDEVVVIENRDKGKETFSKNKDIGELFRKDTHVSKIISEEKPAGTISPQEVVEDFFPEKNKAVEVPWTEKLLQISSKENIEKVGIMEDDVLKEKEAQNIPKQDKKSEEIFTKDFKVIANDDKINSKIVDSENNATVWKEIAPVVDEDEVLKEKEVQNIPKQDKKVEDIFKKDVQENLTDKNENEGPFEGRKISKINDTVTPGNLTQNFGIKRKNDEGNRNQIINFKNDRDDIINFKIDDDIRKLKIIKAFDDIDDVLEVGVLENSVEDEEIIDETGVKRHTKSVQEYQLVVDYTKSHELQDVEKLKTARTKDNHFEGNRLKQVSRKDGEGDRPKRSTLINILKGPIILNKNPVKREASPENGVSKFFSNIYTKVYDMTHSKKDKEVDNNLLLSDSNYNSYDSLYQPNIINNNQNSDNNNQYENNHISDNSLTHSDYTNYNSNYDNNKPGYNTPLNVSPQSGYIHNNINDKPLDNPLTNSNMYGYGYGYNAPINGYKTNSQSYNTPTNGINANSPTYNYNYANGYNYNQPTSNGPAYSPNGYPYNPSSGYENGFGNNLNNPPDYKNNYGSGYGYNTTSYNDYGYNSTQNYGYGYNNSMVNELNNNGTTTAATIVPGCIFCSNFGCQKNYRWMGVACVPIKG